MKNNVNIIANGKPATVELPCRITDFIQRQGLDPRIVIVEHNGEPLRRDQFANTELKEGDRLEVVRIVAGG